MAHTRTIDRIAKNVEAHRRGYAQAYDRIHILDAVEASWTVNRISYRPLRWRVTDPVNGEPAADAPLRDADLLDHLARRPTRILLTGDGGAGKSEWCRNTSLHFATHREPDG